MLIGTMNHPARDPVREIEWMARLGFEFVDLTNGCPVRAKTVQLQENHGPYAKGSTWAEPDVAH